MYHESRGAAEPIDKSADAYGELSFTTERECISLRNYAADSQVLMAAGCQPCCRADVSSFSPLLPGYCNGKLWRSMRGWQNRRKMKESLSGSYFGAAATTTGSLFFYKQVI